jgi:hypothetical protein
MAVVVVVKEVLVLTAHLQVLHFQQAMVVRLL